MNDAIVETPQCALSLSETEWAKENIELVLIDEAHHTPAKTWEQILINFSLHLYPDAAGAKECVLRLRRKTI